ncbi:hypothetical protein KR054_009565 [Drosophila jambulina]|nr:hypothetical protein KR054_009565 [Drosophila jambulina]
MASNTSVRRHVVQVSEIPVAPAVQTLQMVGNNVCAVTQQDIRKVVDFRMFTLCSCLPHCQPSPEAAASTILLDFFAQETPKDDKLANNPYVRREVLKVCETPMAPAVHIPIVVGSEQYVVIQQDIRKEMDIRIFTYNSLASVASAAAPLNVFGGPVTNLQPLIPQVPHLTINPYNLHIEIPKKPSNDVALGRSRNQICYSAGTSTDGLMKNNGCQHCPKCEEVHTSCQTQTSPPSLDVSRQKNVACQTQPATSCSGCNTSSLQLVKKVEVEEEEDSDSCHQSLEQESFVQQGPVFRNRKCPPDEPCTTRLLDMDEQERYDCIRARICAQRLAELRRRRQQQCDTTPQSPPPKEWSNYEQQSRERKQKDNR